MVVIYVLRLIDNKFYVGMTTRNLTRIWEHIEGEGAKWTKKYPPVKGNEVQYMEDGLFPIDENRITLETMREHGYENVRGGSWCQMILQPQQIRGIIRRIENDLPTKRTKSRPDVGEYYKERALKRKKKNREWHKLRGVLLPFNTTPLEKCRAMKGDGRGRCQKNISSNFAGKSSEDQLCNMHRISVLSGRRPWPTISQSRMKKDLS